MLPTTSVMAKALPLNHQGPEFQWNGLAFASITPTAGPPRALPTWLLEAAGYNTTQCYQGRKKNKEERGQRSRECLRQNGKSIKGQPGAERGPDRKWAGLLLRFPDSWWDFPSWGVP